MKTKALYDSIGKSYDTTRKSDPRIAERLLSLLRPAANGKYLDVACGTGNYTASLHKLGISIRGIDQSERMISDAKTKAPDIDWDVGDAEALPFPDGSFDGVICTLATHHFQDIQTAFSEAFRVVRRGRLVIFTAYPDQMSGYWLNEYFPIAMERASRQMLSKTALFGYLEIAGFHEIFEETFEIPHGLEDLFLHSGKHRPEIYLLPQVRAGISTFAKLASEAEIFEGCGRLERDIRSGQIDRVMSDYSNPAGDYVFVVGEKE
jgi:ubiquinone/menaquinone biosynthesis C-methylase UbiE